MSRGTPSEAEVASTLSNLQISSKTPSKPASKPKSPAVAESWDAELSDSSDTGTETPSSKSLPKPTSPKERLSAISTSTTDATSPPNPPPPTPASPIPFEFPDHVPFAMQSQAQGTGMRGGGSGPPTKRPEKTTAVAGRLIAGALGVRAPRRTAEEREYDKAIREKERKRRDAEREKERAEREAAEARKKAIWDD
ncbi:hypothetical protein M011DRAFT_521127 [Sporormia fimetaria CBS 119925]|uniref:Ubiquitin-like protein smt3 n=1 Tax=Sporormia fimetaria CBS 119925 TaxID=1340428 RepID=A0A6A6V3Q3_9PLEO|nr:hypothetical protein M011DRAFT_521127 [Sporormia fimetaria CBS 119925]